MTTYEEVRMKLARGPRTWLVTGAAGFIGSHLTQALLDLDQNVIGLDNFSTGHRRNLQQVRGAVGDARWRRFRLIDGDIRSLDTCRQACRAVDFVLHEAALGSVPRSMEDPLTTHECNVNGFLNMLLAAREAGVERFVYASSSAVYGDHPRLTKIEAETGRPLSPYAATKWMDELYAGIFARCFGFPSVGLRYFNVFGPRQDPNGPYAAVIPLWIAGMIRNAPIYINGDGETARDFCYVDNVVQANLLAASVENASAVSEVYNIAAGDRTTLNELFELMRALLEPDHPHVREIRPIYRSFRPGDVRLSQADIAKARQQLGYQPIWRVREGLARAIEWYATTMEAERDAALGQVAVQAALRGSGETVAP
ncbi:MAG TPA: SDR family oxidoreductase [Burkholderiales bacterium]|nr:SDR family oxidoreductase [Burkholderiales bacterium]